MSTRLESITRLIQKANCKTLFRIKNFTTAFNFAFFIAISSFASKSCSTGFTLKEKNQYHYGTEVYTLKLLPPAVMKSQLLVFPVSLARHKQSFRPTVEEFQ